MKDPVIQKRIESIDILRGLVMIIMALDHVRDYIHITANTDDPLNLATTSPALYFTRWITHFCAPIFVFLSGASIYLQSLRKTKRELSLFIFKRGLWLIIAEVFIITLGWTFNPYYNFIALQVIWAIGISMVLLSALIWLPYRAVLAIGLVIVFSHNLLDIPESAPGFKPTFMWDLLHSGKFSLYAFMPKHFVAIVYPFVAWTGLMLVGYGAGKLFTKEYNASQRKKILLGTGMIMLALFVALRFINQYGDPNPWSYQKNGFYTFLSFIKVTKYPPSLFYLLITIGIALLALALIENIKNRFTSILIVFGRTAFFYYILHIYLIHLIAVILFFINGTHSVEDTVQSMQNLPFLFVIPGEGVNLYMVYLVWLLVVVLLYPLCKWYDRYKTTHKEKWWLSYL